MVTTGSSSGPTDVTSPTVSTFAGPTSPSGITKLIVCSGESPVIVTSASLPGSPVSTVPTVSSFAGPCGPSIPTSTQTEPLQ
jgi:hypothetical protein